MMPKIEISDPHPAAENMFVTLIFTFSEPAFPNGEAYYLFGLN